MLKNSATSLGMTRRRPARLFFKQQLAGAACCFHDRLDECDAEFAFLQFKNAVDGAAGGSSHGVFKKRRVIARFQHKTYRAFHRLRCDKGRYIPLQTDFHASFGKRFQNDVCERRTARRKTRHRVHVLLIEDNRPAYRVEHRASNVEMVRVGMSPTTDCRHAAVNSSRSIWHCSHDWHIIALAACGPSELLLDEACWHRSRDRDNEHASANFGSNLLQHFRNGLRFYC